ncbi:unnamed protein product [Mucor hiemalis]
MKRMKINSKFGITPGMAIGPKLKPGKDLMAKEALRDPKVVNLITESLVKTTDDYFVGNCEWKDGTRSDMVLEPKNAHSDLPPLIVDIQHTVNKAFMKRAISYCLQAFTRYHKEPTILIICVEKLNQDNIHVKLSKLPGVFSYFSEPWAEHCYIISKESTKDNLSIPLHPLVALGPFFTNRCLRRKVQGVCLQKTCERIAFCHLYLFSFHGIIGYSFESTLSRSNYFLETFALCIK